MPASARSVQMCAQIEQPAHAAHDLRNLARVGRAGAQRQFRTLRRCADLDQRPIARLADHVPIAAIVDLLDPRNRAALQKRQHRGQIQWRTIAQPQREFAARHFGALPVLRTAVDKQPIEACIARQPGAGALGSVGCGGLHGAKSMRSPHCGLAVFGQCCGRRRCRGVGVAAGRGGRSDDDRAP